ncbi:hypothetical protein SETIT_8G085100v2 [Setaria italica]|uniref:Uncharacterized protein n=1 Tax=Setaria italica TaxID=4555 RepID=A0A368S5K5_SETIT|nr:hypothetical protein SETIT_8G085100v2 [Setaria italica]
MRGNVIEALHDPTAEVCIMSKYLMDTLVGNKPLTSIDKYFRSPSGFFFESWGLARDVPIIIDKIEVCLDFHIFDILNFYLLLGYLLEKLLGEDASQGSLDEKLRETASAIATSCLENPMAKPHPKKNPLKKVMRVSPFVLSEPVPFKVAEFAAPKECNSEETLHICGDERSPSPSIEFEPLHAGQYHVVFDHDRESTLIFHDESLEMENPWAMEFCEVLTLESKGKDSIDGHGSFILEMPLEPCSFNASPELATLCALSMHEDYNHLKVLPCKKFRRLVVDAYAYHKHCKFCGGSLALTLQLKLQ